MYRGYIKLWRKTLDAGWLQNHKLWVLWSWCLMKASHKEFDVIVGCQSVHLMPGDFIFGLKVASKELRLSIQSIRTLLDFLKNTQNLTIKSTNKFSIISIINWNAYQGEENEINTQTNKPLTNNQQTTNNKQECKELKECKEIKNKGIFVLPEWVDRELWEAFLEVRKKIKKPPTEKAKELLIKKLERFKNKGYNIQELMQNAIEGSWQSFYEPKSGGTNGNQKHITTTESSRGTGTPHFYEGEPRPSDEEIERNKKRIKKLTEQAFGTNKVKI